MTHTSYIELIGPAGAGKTTLIRALVESGEGISVAPKPSLRSPEDLPYFLRNVAALWPLLSTRPRGDRRLTKREMWWMLYLNEWHAVLPSRVSSPNATYLLDHGPIYMLTSLQEFGPALTRSEAFQRFWLDARLRWSSFLDMVIWLDAPNEVLAARIKAREKAHLVKGEPETAIHSFLDRYRAAFQRVVSDASAPADKFRVLELSTRDEAPDRLRDRVLAAL